MTARKKLNAAYVTGAVVVGSVLGAMTGSWVVFLASSVALALVGIHAGDIRLRRNG